MNELQNKIRSQAISQATQLQELIEWEEEVAKKEKDLIHSKESHIVKKDYKVPLPRQSVNNEVIAVSKKATSKDGEKIIDNTSLIPAEIHQSLKSQNKKITSQSSTVDVLSNKSATSADFAKDEGNSFFRIGDYANAIKCYTKAIELDKSSVASLSNRAMAYIKTKQYNVCNIIF